MAGRPIVIKLKIILFCIFTLYFARSSGFAIPKQ